MHQNKMTKVRLISVWKQLSFALLVSSTEGIQDATMSSSHSIDLRLETDNASVLGSLKRRRRISDFSKSQSTSDELSMVEIEEPGEPSHVSTRSFLNRPNPFVLRTTVPFEDPLGNGCLHELDPLASWTPESLCQFENRFGPKSRPQLLSTGTTIAGVCGYDNGQPFVVLGADTRATAGRMVADKHCSKVHCLASNMWCCGAGTSADLDHITRRCRYTMAMQYRLEQESIGNLPQTWPAEHDTVDSDVEPIADHSASMASVCRFFRNVLYEASGNVGANIIAGGVDEGTGVPHIRAIHPHGSMDPLPYAALGSGGLAAMAVIESRYRQNMTMEEGIQMVKEAILSGIENDMGSGSQVDICIIKGDKAGRVSSEYTRAVVPEEELEASMKNPTSIGTNAATVSSIPGVNGFSNVPFSIQSSRVIVEGREEDAKETNRWRKYGLQ